LTTTNHIIALQLRSNDENRVQFSVRMYSINNEYKGISELDTARKNLAWNPASHLSRKHCNPVSAASIAFNSQPRRNLNYRDVYDYAILVRLMLLRPKYAKYIQY